MKSGLADLTLENRKKLKETVSKLAKIILKKEEVLTESKDQISLEDEQISNTLPKTSRAL